MPHQGKVALVTGGARGIGLGIALKLADAGFTLVISGRRPFEEVQPALNEIKKRSGASIYIQADVSDGSDRARLLPSPSRHPCRYSWHLGRGPCASDRATRSE